MHNVTNNHYLNSQDPYESRTQFLGMWYVVPLDFCFSTVSVLEFVFMHGHKQLFWLLDLFLILFYQALPNHIDSLA